MTNARELRAAVTKAVDDEFNESAGVLAAMDLANNAAYKAGYFRQLAITALCKLKIEENAYNKLRKLTEQINTNR